MSFSYSHLPFRPVTEYKYLSCFILYLTTVFLLSPLQASNQTDLENWVTAIHSASASLMAKRQGKEDTVRLLRSQVRALLQKVDMDGKMKKMAELQLTVVNDPKNRKAIENQVREGGGGKGQRKEGVEALNPYFTQSLIRNGILKHILFRYRYASHLMVQSQDCGATDTCRRFCFLLDGHI